MLLFLYNKYLIAKEDGMIILLPTFKCSMYFGIMIEKVHVLSI